MIQRCKHTYVSVVVELVRDSGLTELHSILEVSMHCGWVRVLGCAFKFVLLVSLD